ncbi:uroporphyrinogen-III C-methyltransferase [Polynucleobacter sp. AP-Sanab-80-C2]|uniref:uroporphyrinogen-III C-methyltransferase n=1 Tax=Polynucleobacter sp. AP-Sanab-80-C2 TaxID=3108274 RepID=UPI002B22DC59|nr:uroporphyrinogen-III C-methyltransferase [Polynucleobacter sp. AP-Sanab-80-C2]MEA9598514.1 uroporphyrinogen-III C-methyltransferase [Polynucleobacter sp. AP-Sanab-80-C2]
MTKPNNLRSDQMNANTPGKVYLVGAGPGAVDLITVRGAKLLAQADIVFYDALVDAQMLDLCPQAEKIAVGKRCGKLSSAQQFINKRLVDAAQKHQIVVRLKGGDPMLFGRADEELTTLKQAGVEVEVVPGITAALAGAASIQQSLTLRGVSRSVAFITLAQASEGTENVNPNQPISNPSADTLVYYMGRKDAAKIAQQLIAQGKNHTEDTPVQILEAVSTSKERQWENNLGALAQGKADNWFDRNSPALIMVGEALRSKQSTTTESQSSSTEIDDGLQNGKILTNGRRRA